MSLGQKSKELPEIPLDVSSKLNQQSRAAVFGLWRTLSLWTRGHVDCHVLMFVDHQYGCVNRLPLAMAAAL